MPIYRNIDAGVTGAVVKASPGRLYGYYIANASAALRYVKVYDKATAPTGSDTPVLTLPIPIGGALSVMLPGDRDEVFSAGISIRASTGIADNDTGAPSSNDVIVNLFYR